MVKREIDSESDPVLYHLVLRRMKEVRERFVSDSTLSLCGPLEGALADAELQRMTHSLAPECQLQIAQLREIVVSKTTGYSVKAQILDWPWVDVVNTIYIQEKQKQLNPHFNVPAFARMAEMQNHLASTQFQYYFNKEIVYEQQDDSAQQKMFAVKMYDELLEFFQWHVEGKLGDALANDEHLMSRWIQGEDDEKKLLDYIYYSSSIEPYLNARKNAEGEKQERRRRILTEMRKETRRNREEVHVRDYK